MMKNIAGVIMRVGNLPQASLRSRGAFVFQVMRVFIVTVIAASGALAVSLSVGDPGALEQVAAADRLPDGTGPAPAAGEAPQQAVQAAPVPSAPVQVATADPLAGVSLAGASMDGGAPPTDPQQPAEDDAASAPMDAGGGPAAAPTGGDTPMSGAPLAVSDVAPPVDAEMTGAVTGASPPGEPDPAGERIDLNTATLAQLNALRNAGPVGRAIIRNRPYASVEDLVKRRIVRRSVYERIKDQVAVR
ncbi:helix-hairpin-helix domain-containing protein [Microvirga pakistanensis]|uniref:helix-hairpin-helix domain-containing protein n=1 Tax=Microvirga pakistanensis TaxID=1682650 RepID=UPI001FCF03C1|nr:helix-hairpin-helix domain-containing protein [Microvirga pakistanensis]